MAISCADVPRWLSKAAKGVYSILESRGTKQRAKNGDMGLRVVVVHTAAMVHPRPHVAELLLLR